jgi:NTE family protein
VLHEGSLPRAVRASMAIPGVFTPVQIDGRVLADGGMVENIPVEAAREMDADKVIAIDLQMPLGGKEQLETITGVLSRAVSVMILQNERQSLKLADATVIVDTGNFSMTDYDRVSDLIRLGYQSAARHAAALLPYAIQDGAEWQQYLSARNARKHSPPKEVQSVTVEGGDSDTNHRIERRLKSDTGVPLNLPKLETQLTRIAGQGEFDRLGYEGFTQHGVPALRVTAHEKTYGPPFVDLAVNVDGSGVAAFDFSAGARITFMDVEHHGGEWRNDLMLGSSNLAATEFYQPIGQYSLLRGTLRLRFQVAPQRIRWTEPASPSSATNARAAVSILAMTPAAAANSAGVTRSSAGNCAADRQRQVCPQLSGSTGEFRTRYVWDGQDSPSIPSRGHAHRCQPRPRAAKPRPRSSHRSTRCADFHLHPHQRKDLALLARLGRNHFSRNG